MTITAPPTTLLEQPITSGGLRTVNFFNGRLLTGEDLDREQQANRLARLRLGTTVGTGVACGLGVREAAGSSASEPVVTVDDGLALNALGQPLELRDRVTVSLIDAPRAAGSASGPDFTDCSPGAGDTTPAGSGTFVLAIGPSRTPSGRAPVSGLGNEAAICNVDTAIEGVCFTLLRLAIPVADRQPAALLRSRLARRLLGVWGAEDVDPFGSPDSLLAQLRRACLDPYLVPLAVVHWTAASGIVFVDRWAVRRRIVAPPADDRFPWPLRDARSADAEALVLQAHDHLDDLRREEDGRTLRAVDRFAFLPPIGVLPLASSTHPQGFDDDRFFDGLTLSREAYAEAGALGGLLDEALSFGAIDCASPKAIRRYLVRENQQDATAQKVVVFTHGLVRYRADAQFDLFHFDHANYAQRYA